MGIVRWYGLRHFIRTIFKLNQQSSVFIDSIKWVRLRQVGPAEIEISGWSWPRREHIGQAVKQLLRLELAQLKALRQSFSQAELGRRLTAISQNGSACLQANQTWVTYLLVCNINSAVRKFAITNIVCTVHILSALCSVDNICVDAE